jgi:adenylosuccinate synthase
MVDSFGVLGLNWGDEGKGKVIHYLAEQAAQRYDAQGNSILNMRFQGGGNAGHTVYHNGQKYGFHLLPSTILTRGVYNLIGSGALINPRKLVDEINTIRGEITPYNLGISSRAHITLDHHVAGDQAAFKCANHTSTGNGIKQTATDKYNRVGLRFVEFLDANLMKEILETKSTLGELPEGTSIDDYVKSYEPQREVLQDFLVSEQDVVTNPEYRFHLKESANGVLLSVDSGQYPGITSSSPEIFPYRTDNIIGVVKAYCSSVGVGDRAFVSEMPEGLQKVLREPWCEFGTTTGRPRNLGWFDAVATRYAMEVSGATHLALTCLDRLEELSKHGINPEITVAYEVDGKQYDRWDVNFDRRDVLRRAKPITVSVPSWSTTRDEESQSISLEASAYVETIEWLLGAEFSIVSVGPEDKDTLILDEII